MALICLCATDNKIGINAALAANTLLALLGCLACYVLVWELVASYLGGLGAQ